MKFKVCAVIVSYNIDEKIIEVISSIKEQVSFVYIIDNASNKKTKDILVGLSDDKVEIIFNEYNLGIAKALNQGVKLAQQNNFEWILTLDHDSICPENMVDEMFYSAMKYPEFFRTALLAPRVLDINMNRFISKQKNLNLDYTEINDCIQSGSLFRVSIFDEIGYFNEDLFIYHVDFEFCQRIKSNRMKIIQCNNVILAHEEGQKVAHKCAGMIVYYNNYSPIATYYITRNTIFMCKKYNFIYSKRLIKDLVFIILYDSDKLNMLKYWLRGLFDGITNNLGKIKINS